MINSTLPVFQLCGPDIPGSTEQHRVTFWQIQLAVPNYAGDTTRPTSQIERIHAIRTLLLDPTAVQSANDAPVFPNLVDAYLTSGGAYDPGSVPNPSFDFTINLTAGRSGEENFHHSNFLTVPENPVIANETDGLVHITASPINDPGASWSDTGDNSIKIPNFRLVQGAVALKVALKDIRAWLKPSFDLVPTAGDSTFTTIWLTRDGIEITANIPFPGKPQTAANPLRGVFLLTPFSHESYRLSLMADRLDAATTAQWMVLWTHLLDANQSNTLQGYRVDLNRRALPLLSWDCPIDTSPLHNNVLGLKSNAVTVPGDAIKVRLAGPETRGGPDGTVDIAPATWTIETRSSGVPSVFAAAAVRAQKLWGGSSSDWNAAWFVDQDPNANYWQWIGKVPVQQQGQQLLLTAALLPDKVTAPPYSPATKDFLDLFTPPIDPTQPVQGQPPTEVKIQSANRNFVFDEIELAAELRSAQGLPGLAPGQMDPETPLVWGFLPLDDGWLQLPLLNRPPLDPGKDSSFVQVPAADPPNILSGFLRFEDRGDLPSFLTIPAPDKIPNLSVDRAPWSVLVDGARAAAFALALNLDVPQSTTNPALVNLPVAAFLHLIQPELTANGWLWLSSDCPDETEALPRIGAGAGQYLNVALQQQQANSSSSFLNVSLADLTFTYQRNLVSALDVIERKNLTLNLGYVSNEPTWTQLKNQNDLVRQEYSALVGNANAKVPNLFPCVYWMRHDVMPLAASMPMTRSVNNAIPALESRDLVPFVFQAAGSTTAQIRLNWDSKDPGTAAFPTFLDGTGAPPALLPAGGWPWARSFPLQSTGADAPAQGIALAALGAPGAELSFDTSSASADPWTLALGALRYDLPGLDEAFANTVLPPTPAVKTIDASAPPPPEPVSTACNWRSMARLWARREKAHTLSRVMHSYMTGFLQPGKTSAVGELVGEMKWSAQAGFLSASNDDPLPYGSHTFAPPSPAPSLSWKGNDALLGYSGPAQLAGPSGPLSTAIVGYAPATIEDPPAGANASTDQSFWRDARGTGQQRLQALPDPGPATTLQRPISYLSGTRFTLATLVTLLEPISIDNLTLKFWFKDLPFDSSGKLTFPDQTQSNTNAWQDGQLPLQGGEWRLWDDSADGKESFKTGDSVFVYCGLTVEPLKLMYAQIDANSALTNAVLCCRVHLGPRPELPDNSNLVYFKLTKSTAGNAALSGPYLKEPLVSGDTLANPIFSFPVSDAELGDFRRARVETGFVSLAQPAVGWKADLVLTLFGRDLKCTGAALKPANPGQSVIITWQGPSAPAGKTFVPGTAQLGLAKIEITVTAETSTTDSSAYVSEFSRWIALLPHQTGDNASPLLPALVATFDTTSGSPTANPAPTNKLNLLGVDVTIPDSTKLLLKELTGSASLIMRSLALQRAAGAAKLPLPASLLNNWTLDLGLIARVQIPDSGSIAPSDTQALVAGYLHAQARTNNTQQLILAEASCQKRPPPLGGSTPAQQAVDPSWIGQLTFYFQLDQTNLIGWPTVTVNTAPPQVIKGVKLPQNPASDVIFDGTQLRQHGVTYNFWGHTMSFALASALADPTETAVYSVPIMAHHKIVTPGGVAAVEFDTVETIAIGRLNRLIPVITASDETPTSNLATHPFDDNRSFARDPLTFGARYNFMPADLAAQGSHYRPGDDLRPGPVLNAMTAAGLGRFAFMLQGTQGLALRVALHHYFNSAPGPATPDKTNPLLLIGGFVGTVTWPPLTPNQDADSPLVRLPVLLLLAESPQNNPPILPQNARGQRYSWADTAYKNVRWRLRQTVIPNSKSFADLTASLWNGQPLPDGVHPAVLADQAFTTLQTLDHPGFDDVADPALRDKTVFFPAAAMSIQKLLSNAPQDAASLANRTVISLLGTTDNQSASLSPLQSALNLPAPVALAVARLVTLGDDVVLGDWANAGDEPNKPAILTKAQINHPRPLAALIIASDSQRTSLYQVVDSITHLRRLTYVEPRAKMEFAEPQRGYPFSPAGQMSSWIYSVEEGSTNPIRDSLPGKYDLSGVAGLSRRVNTPQQAVPTGKSDPGPVFISELRAPIYQVDAIQTQLQSTPVGWLSPSNTRPRLPAGSILRKALEEIYGVGSPSASGDELQWIVPSGYDTVSVGDRAGISLARITRIEKQLLPDGEDFDSSFPRFGQPAQGGAWSQRTERTPRPGPLPANADSNPSAQNRRPCSSPLSLDSNCSLNRGSADVVTGESKLIKANVVVRWVAHFIAAAPWNGLVLDNWDGSLPVDIKIELSDTPASAAGWASALNVLLHFAGNSGLLNSAQLAIGDTLLYYSNLNLTSLIFQGGTTAHCTGILTMAAGTSATDSPRAKIAAAMKTAARLPSVELRVCVFDDDPATGAPQLPPLPANLPLALPPVPPRPTDPYPPSVPLNDLSCPPVTLRMPLSPILRDRGALPLPRHSLIFCDPSYDDSLGSKPEMHKLQVSGVDPDLVNARGPLYGYLYTDRNKADLQGRIILMVDLAFELAAPADAQAPAGFDGDYNPDRLHKTLTLSFQRISTTSGETTKLYFYNPYFPYKTDGSLLPPNSPITFATVYEIPVAMLRDSRGKSVLQPGDILQISVVLNQDASNAPYAVDLFWPNHTAATSTYTFAQPFIRTLDIEISGLPVAEPPPSLYALMLRRKKDLVDRTGNLQTGYRLSLPLHAQSPYPWRISPINAKDDFRAGFIRRSAFFIWPLARPTLDWQSASVESKVYLVKMERSGQTYLPEKDGELVSLISI